MSNLPTPKASAVSDDPSPFALPQVRAVEAIRIKGVRTHNLKGFDIELPHNKLTVITGVSGSGKSSLAFDTIFAEGQRQYVDSLSVYARQFLDQLQRPDVESIDGLQPTLCIDQRNAAANPRSTVATVTEIYDYLRLLMAKAGLPHCFTCGAPIQQQSADQILATLSALPEGTRLIVMAPVVRGRPGGHKDVLEQVRKAGLVKVRVDEQLYDIEQVPELAVRKKHTIDAIVDKIIIRPGSMTRMADSLRLALSLAGGLVTVSTVSAEDAKASTEGGQQANWDERLFSTLYACANCGISYEEVEPRTFSFNSPYGACPACQGMGTQPQFDPESIIVDWDRSPADGGLLPWQTAPTKMKRALRGVFEKLLNDVDANWDAPLSKLKAAARRQLISGAGKGESGGRGIIGHLQHLFTTAADKEDTATLEWLENYRQALPCLTVTARVCVGKPCRSRSMVTTFISYVARASRR